MKDGWHIIKDYECYVENNKIIRGVKRDSNGSAIAAYPYRYNRKFRVWTNAVGITVSTFRNSKLYELK